MTFNHKYEKLLLVSIGAIPGAIIRWQIDDFFVVNLIGCFFIGFINRLSISSKFKLILGFGFCGSFTTFSTWILNLFRLISDGFFLQFILRSMFIVCFSLVAVYLGDLLAKKLTRLV